MCKNGAEVQKHKNLKQKVGKYIVKFNQELCEVGARIQARRRELNMTASELAIQIDVTPATISKIENGQVATNINILIAIAKVLKVSLDYFQPKELDQYSSVTKEMAELNLILKSKTPYEQKIIMKGFSGMVYAE